MIPIISFVGYSNSGKTTLLVKVIEELKKRGYKVATIKHHSHDEFEIDKKGKDTWNHAQAGADTVIISSPKKYALIAKTEEEQTLDEIAGLVKNVDIIITEGYKKGDKPKVEVFRKETGRTELLCKAEELIAVASNKDFNIAVPLFPLDDVQGLTNLIIGKFIKK